MTQDAIYLRKSRKDTLDNSIEDTLSRHEKALAELAEKLGKNVVHIYREVVSGETISARPEMQKLLQAVENGEYDSVLVMEVERLARGNTIDQGIVAQTFKYTDTEIVTPLKTYHPNDDNDEEYFEFGLFMSRREYKTITRRMNRGRIASLKEGKWISNKAPFGYERYKLPEQKGFSLKIVPEQAKIVQLIFNSYAFGYTDENGKTDYNFGVVKIAKLLEQMGIKNMHGGSVWAEATIRDMLHNPTYIGLIRWGYNPQEKRIKNGQMYKVRGVHNSDCQYFKGLHEPIISEELYNAVQNKTKSHKRKVPINTSKTLMNPLAGLTFCEQCGKPMQRKPFQNATTSLICVTRGCNCVSSGFNLVEIRLLKTLTEWLKEYKISFKKNKIINMPASTFGISDYQKQLDKLNKQLDNACELLEQGVYTTDIFISRKAKIDTQIKELNIFIEQAKTATAERNKAEEFENSFIPNLELLVNSYWELETTDKNRLLKEVVNKIVYNRTVGGKYCSEGNDNFTLTVYPRYPL